MLEDIPVGNPVLSLSNDLNSYFGFVYAEIIPPKNLDFYFIPLRDKMVKLLHQTIVLKIYILVIC